MAEFAPLERVEGGAAFDGGDEGFDGAEEGDGVVALGGGDGAIEYPEPESFEAGVGRFFVGDELVGEHLGAFAEEVVAQQEERLRGDDRLIALTRGHRGVHEVEEGSQTIRPGEVVAKHGQVDRALELLARDTACDGCNSVD